MRDTTENGVRTITLEREPMNTLDLDAIESLSALFESHPPAIPLVIEGAGGVFSAGVDAKAFMGYAQAQRLQLARAITRMTGHLLSIPSPVVASIGGHALGGGLVLALCCDYRVATDAAQAKFGLLEAKAGIAFPAGPAQIIHHELPPPLLRHLSLSSHTVPSSLLFDHTVFDECVEPARVSEVAHMRALELARLPGFAVVKAQIRGGLALHVRRLADDGRELAFEEARPL
jgi:enoyl-CoA hydratase